MEYFEQTGNARIQFWWEYAATAQIAQTTPVSPIYRLPSSYGTVQPTSPAVNNVATTLPGPWLGEYFNGRDLRKSPVLVRTDPVIDFDWKWLAPSPDMSANQFAIRWTGTFIFEQGLYRFTTTTDDGVRIYIDDRLILNNWRPMRGTRYTTVAVEPGEHEVKVEYFEAMQAAKARVQWAWVSD